MTYRTFNKTSGFSLLEMLIVLTVFSCIVGGLMTSLNKGQQRFQFEQDVLEAQQTGRNALDMMERELRLAGLPTLSCYDAAVTVSTNMVSNGITTANTSNLIFEGDINEDGIVETVQYTLSGSTLRRSAVPKGTTASLQVMAQNVSGLTFSYFDSAGNSLSTPVVSPSSIRRVQIAVVLATNRVDPETRQLSTVSLTSSAVVRNL